MSETKQFTEAQLLDAVRLAVHSLCAEADNKEIKFKPQPGLVLWPKDGPFLEEFVADVARTMWMNA